MEFIIGFVVVVALLLALGVSGYYILLGVFVLMLLTLAATVVFFAVTAFTLLGSHREHVRFDRIEKPEGGHFNCAIYKNASGEFRNVFPSEGIFVNYIYDTERATWVLVTRRGRAYDRYSLTTIIAGLSFGTVSLIMLGWWAVGTLL